MDVEGNEFQDWEVLQDSDESGPVDPVRVVGNIRELEGIEGASEGMVQTDYFSLDSQNKFGRNFPRADWSEEGSVESDNPSWIDPVPETQYLRKEPSEFWSDSSSDPSDDRKSGEFGVKNELGIAGNDKSQIVLGAIGVESENSGKLWFDSGGMESVSTEIQYSENDREITFLESGKSRDVLELQGEKNKVEGSIGGGEQSSRNANVAAIEAEKSCAEGGKKSVVWWKLPLEFVRYYVLRASPVWTFSLAAAVVGFVILGRRLYRMRKKSRSMPLKLTVDDKKVSQFMSRAARLNEAFSVVKRVPVVRPSLPASGLAQWPVMSLR